MPFTQDLFISYTHMDNEPLEGQDHGWVKRFHDTLAVQLGLWMGEKPVIWWDKKLDKNDNFSEEIVAQFACVGLLVSVLSPRYLTSYWCRKEAAEFCKAAEASGGVQVNRKLRIFKVYRLPVKLDGLPEEFQQSRRLSLLHGSRRVRHPARSRLWP